MRDDNRAWRAHLVTGLALAAAHLLLPVEASSSSYAFLAVAVTGPIAIAIGMGRQSHGWPWMMVLLGTSVMVAGDVLWTWYDEVAGVDPFPSLADALYLPGYPLIAFGLLRMLRHRQHGNARAGLIDATIIATGCGVLAWVFLIAPYVRDTELTISERAVSSAYPLMASCWSRWSRASASPDGHCTSATYSSASASSRCSSPTSTSACSN